MHMEDAVKAALNRRGKIRVSHKLTKDALYLSVLFCLILNKQTSVYPPVLSPDPFTGHVFDQCFFLFLYHSAIIQPGIIRTGCIYHSSSHSLVRTISPNRVMNAVIR